VGEKVRKTWGKEDVELANRECLFCGFPPPPQTPPPPPY